MLYDRPVLRSSSFYSPFPLQQQFHTSPALNRLFGGAAGPGKSASLLMEAVFQANSVENANTLLLRRTFPELESSLLREFHTRIPRDAYRSFSEGKHTVTWHNGATTRFGYCRRENDVYQFQGAEYLFIGVDELTLFSLKMWQYLTSRNRCPAPGSFPCMAAATNPGNIGHAWVKALWIQKQAPAGFEKPELYDPSEYDFIPARLTDNPVYANDAAYRRKLELLPRTLRKQLLEGSWDEFAGQFFDNFDLGKHTTRFGDKDCPKIEPWHPRWISIDWGFEHPSAIYWHAQTGTKVVTYREWVQAHVTPRMLAQGIAERSKFYDENNVPWPEKISSIYLSPDAYAKRTDEDTIAEQLGHVLSANGLPRPQPADNDRVGGWLLMYQLLDTENWVILDNCKQLIATIPILVRDMEKRPEDVLKMDGDDPGDSARYGLKSRLSPGKMPAEQRIAAKMTSSDPTIRAMQARVAIAEIKKENRPVHYARRGPRFRKN